MQQIYLEQARAFVAGRELSFVHRRIAARDRLLDRLAHGFVWLQETGAVLRDTGQVVTPLAEQFGANLALWDELDLMLRELYGYRSCALGHSCPEPAEPIRCRACADTLPDDMPDAVAELSEEVVGKATAFLHTLITDADSLSLLTLSLALQEQGFPTWLAPECVQRLVQDGSIEVASQGCYRTAEKAKEAEKGARSFGRRTPRMPP